MIEWFMSGGVVMWPLLVLAIGVMGLAAREAITLRQAGGSGTQRTSHGTTLFWGVVALLVGALGTVVGIVIMARTWRPRAR